MSEYMVASAGNILLLGKVVTKLLDDGWIVSGSMVYSYERGEFYQPMVRA